MAFLASNALDAKLKGNKSTLFDHLNEDGFNVFDRIEQFEITTHMLGDTELSCEPFFVIAAKSHS